MFFLRCTIYSNEVKWKLYKPVHQELSPCLKPFIQDYIPAVGEVDAFLKPPRPDDQKENLGLTQLDEPCLNQSKRSYLDLMIRQFYKGKKKLYSQKIHSIQNAHKKGKEVAGWVQDVEELQRKKQAPSVFYSNKMPEIDNLMQKFDEGIQKELGNVERAKKAQTLEFEESDMPLELLTESLCGVMGIPIYEDDKRTNGKLLFHLSF